MSATREEIAKLYIATFNRAADASGLAYWISDGTSSTTNLTNLEDLASAMTNSQEYKALYDGLDREHVVIAMYQNLFDRNPDNDGLEYWTGIDINGDGIIAYSGAGKDIPIDKLIIALINGAQDSDLGKDKTIMDNKAKVGLAFADTLGDSTNITNFDDLENDPAYIAAQKVMENVTDDPTSVDTVLDSISKLEGRSDATEIIARVDELSVDNILEQIGDSVQDDFPSNTSTTGVLDVGSSLIGNIEMAPQDGDWFALNLEAKHTYDIDVEGASASKGTLADPDIGGIYDSSGKLIGFEDSITPDKAHVTFTPPDDATYYVSVYAWDTGTYTISLEENNTQNIPNDDYPDNISTTGVLDINSSINGEIQQGYYNIDIDKDWIEVQLEANRIYTIDLEGASTEKGTLPDPAIDGIYNNYGIKIAGGDNDSGEDLNSQLIFTAPETDTYYIGVGAFAGGGLGTYTLSITTDLNVIPDIGESLLSHSTISTGENLNGLFEKDQDSDWYAITLNSGYEYTISANSTDSTAYLFIRDSDGNILYSDDGVQSIALDNTDAAVKFDVSNSGTYYIDVKNFYAGEGSYTLSVDNGNFIDPTVDDYPSDITTSGALSIGSSATGNIETAYDTDWFAVELEANQRYTIDLEGSPTDKGTLFDTYIDGIYDNSGELLDYLITKIDSGGVGNNAQLTFSVELPGTYYISAGAFGTYTGTYTLSIDTADSI